MRALLLLFCTVLWISASVVLATANESTPTVLRIGAGIIVGLPAAAGVALSFSQIMGRPPVWTRRNVKWILKTALVEMHRSGPFRGDISQVSLHVWVVPVFWRFLVPRRVRRRHSVQSKVPAWLRAPIWRFVSYRLEHQPRSDIGSFRRSVGLVGRCVDENRPSKLQIVRFYAPEFQGAISRDDRWTAASAEVNQGLTRAQGEELAERYSQAVAVVLQARGAPIGCITLDLPPRCTVNLPEGDQEALERDPRIAALKRAAVLTERALTVRG